MTRTDEPLPNDIETLKAMLLAERTTRLVMEAEAKARTLLIEQMKFIIAKLRHERFGQSSERGALLEQLELQLADLEEDASEAEAQAQAAAQAAAGELPPPHPLPTATFLMPLPPKP